MTALILYTLGLTALLVAACWRLNKQTHANAEATEALVQRLLRAETALGDSRKAIDNIDSDLDEMKDSIADLEARKPATYKPRPTAVAKLDTETGFAIETYPTIAAASKANNIDRSSICKVLKGERKTAAGYAWKTIE